MASSLRAALVAALVIPWATVATATWSVAAVDPATREVGVAGASCILGAEVIAIVVPGHGAAVAQAFTNPEARIKLRQVLASGRSAQEAVDAVASRWFDSFVGAPTVNLRQYGVASLASPETPANFTGRWAFGWKGARTGRGVTVQGNSLRGPAVVEDALAAFEAEGEGCRRTLADRLVSAVVAGSRAGGDVRCAEALSSLSAFVHVAAPDDPVDRPRLLLVRNRPGEPPWSLWGEIRNALRPEPGTRDENPTLLLRASYDAWLSERGAPPRCPPR